jgi:hypothetical protein
MSPTTGFGPWLPLTAASLDALADAPGAVQLATADQYLIDYPAGKSTMVFYFYAARSMREALRRVFADELDEPGSRGVGPLAFRTCAGGDDARDWLSGLFDEFVARFGRAPILHPSDDDDDDNNDDDDDDDNNNDDG